MSEDLN